MEDSRTPVYFSHSYRASDRDVNGFFWDVFWRHGLSFKVDPKTGPLSVPALERMMKQSAGFAAVVTVRHQQPYFQCSPYILYEYGLAVQAQKPRLVFVETGVAGKYFPPGEGIITFNRQQVELRPAEFVQKVEAAVKRFADKCRPYADIHVKPLGSVGMILGAGAASRRVYKQSHDGVRELLNRLGYETRDLHFDSESNFKIALDLDSFDFVVIDVNPSLSPPWIYPFIHGRFVPSVKLFHLPGSKSSEESLPPLVKGQLLPGMTPGDDPILFWRKPEELLSKLEQQLQKLKSDRKTFASREEGWRYFRGLGRPPAKIFVSNSGDANAFAGRLVRQLDLEGIDTFQYVYRNTIDIGSEWQRQLKPKINDSEIFVMLMTQGYWASTFCQQEFAEAERLRLAGKLTVVPFYLEDVRGGPAVEAQGETLIGMAEEAQVQRIASRLDAMLLKRSLPESGREEEGRQMTAAHDADAPVDIAIITVIEAEYTAVRRYLDATFRVPPGRVTKYGWELGHISSPAFGKPYRVVLAMAGNQGTNNAVLATKDTVQTWKPSAVVLVGIAGGRAVDGLEKGDVVVSEVIWGYEYGKIEEGFQPRQNYTYQVNSHIVTAARVHNIKQPGWKDSIQAKPPTLGKLPKLAVGPVASGDKLVDDETDAFFQRVVQKWPKLVAIEMEGAGAAAAIKSLQDEKVSVSFTMVRGISDMPRTAAPDTGDAPPPAQTTERDAWKQFAAEAAACFTVDLIRNNWPWPPAAEGE